MVKLLKRVIFDRQPKARSTTRILSLLVIVTFLKNFSVRSSSTTFWMISYATSSFLPKAVQLLDSARLMGFITKLYTPSDLDQDFIVRNDHILQLKRGAGFWLWKPYIIFHHLLYVAEENDIVCYIDAVNKRFDNHFDLFLLLSQWTSEPPYVRPANRKPGFQFYEEVMYTKMDSYLIMNTNRTYSGMEAYQVWAGFLAMKRSFQAISFISEWLTYCRDDRNLLDNPSMLLRNDDQFIENRHDQSVLHLLTRKWKISAGYLPESIFKPHSPEISVMLDIIEKDPRLFSLGLDETGTPQQLFVLISPTTINMTAGRISRNEKTYVFFFSVYERDVCLVLSQQLKLVIVEHKEFFTQIESYACTRALENQLLMLKRVLTGVPNFKDFVLSRNTPSA